MRKGRNPKVFKGEGDLMVDRLVAACAVKQTGPIEPLPGFGRDLVPYFNAGSEGKLDDINEVLHINTQPSRETRTRSCDSSKRVASCDSSKRMKKQYRKKIDIASQERPSSSGDSLDLLTYCQKEHSGKTKKPKTPKSSYISLAKVTSSVPLEQQQKVVQAFAASAAASKNLSRQGKSNPRQIPAKTLEENISAENTNSCSPENNRWAGGAFTNSPNPTHVPLPSLLGSPFSSTEDLASLKRADSNQRLVTPGELLQKALQKSLGPVRSIETVATQRCPLYYNQNPYQTCGRAASTDNECAIIATHALREMLNF
eukprot:CAMPEP_0196579702 /NCGR_PEP_ID=MMETSP1081-20130531/24462_1 /TAXON_ID=36882 /ORGANISM="Pyramimonas amylifera, Strain CCMP720" /LENGTH=313 /DNA_ID=CAMNT_0041899361 /DNA_START=229 /DNA_END=1170 /DNA_ORIENTATION=-